MLTYTMKVKQKPYAIAGNEGIKFEFNDFDGMHEETLVLKRDGEPAEGVHRSPLYRLQELEPAGEMVEVEFEIYTEKLQQQQEGRRDSIKHRRALRVGAVRPVKDPVRSNGSTGDKARA